MIHGTFVPAAERHAETPGRSHGRATFEWVEIEDVPAIRWRRVGRQAIFDAP